MNNPVSIPTVSKCVEIFGDDEGRKLHKILQNAQFRNERSLQDQLVFLKSARQTITVREITKFLGISNDYYYKGIRNEQTESPTKLVPPSRQLLTENEENAIIELIHVQQLQKDCWSGKDIRVTAAEMYENRTGIARCFNRNWMRDFRERHKDYIEKVITNAIETPRAQISGDEVEKYIRDIEELMIDPPNPFLLINFDETGFERKPDKGKKKKSMLIYQRNT